LLFKLKLPATDHHNLQSESQEVVQGKAKN